MEKREEQDPEADRGLSSHCMICGRDYFDRRVERCPRCGGICRIEENHVLILMSGRRAAIGSEQQFLDEEMAA